MSLEDGGCGCDDGQLWVQEMMNVSGIKKKRKKTHHLLVVTNQTRGDEI
jgi:hypothetical protein